MTHPPPLLIREKVEEVFGRPEFRPVDDRPTGWLMRLLGDFFAWLGSLHEQSPALFWLLLAVCVLLLLALLTHIAFQVRSLFAATGRVRATQERAERERRSNECRAESDRRAEAGDYTEAIRFLFLSLIYRFDESGRIGLHKESTNREYLDLVGDRNRVRDALRVMVDLLDDHWYGLKPCDRSQYEDCLAAYERAAAAS
jgi:hypothetical protein